MRLEYLAKHAHVSAAPATYCGTTPQARATLCQGWATKQEGMGPPGGGRQEAQTQKAKGKEELTQYFAVTPTIACAGCNGWIHRHGCSFPWILFPADPCGRFGSDDGGMRN